MPLLCGLSRRFALKKAGLRLSCDLRNINNFTINVSFFKAHCFAYFASPEFIRDLLSAFAVDFANRRVSSNSMRQALFFLVTLFLLASCSGRHPDDNRYNNNYRVGEIPDLASFQTLNEEDKRLDSLLQPGNGLIEGSFKNNRSRIFMQSFSNNKPSSQDSALYRGMPTPCYCSMEKDTLKIKVGIGFSGGMGTEIKIFQGHFQSNYFLYIDDVKPYKYKLSDKEFTDELYLKNKFQSLILNEQPTLKAGQQMTGYLTFTTPNWYENSVGERHLHKLC